MRADDVTSRKHLYSFGEILQRTLTTYSRWNQAMCSVNEGHNFLYYVDFDLH
jgi:hypothetical protein